LPPQKWLPERLGKAKRDLEKTRRRLENLKRVLEKRERAAGKIKRSLEKFKHAFGEAKRPLQRVSGWPGERSGLYRLAVSVGMVTYWQPTDCVAVIAKLFHHAPFENLRVRDSFEFTLLVDGRKGPRSVRGNFAIASIISLSMIRRRAPAERCQWIGCKFRRQ
jgi:hypothetical protein